ncbi:succinate dehydrogenase, partial [Mycobacterium sp. ITM-2017-0098]
MSPGKKMAENAYDHISDRGGPA